MTALNSRLFPSLFAAVYITMAGIITASAISGCGTEKPDFPSHRCQAVVVLDKTASVSYNSSLAEIQQQLTRDFETTYSAGTRNIQCSRIIITGNTSVIPQPDYYNEPYPNTEEIDRETEQAILKWKTGKRKWISEEVSQITALIDSPCNSKSTDIFSIFSGIQMAQKGNQPGDTVNVYIYSDMVNTCKPINMNKELTIENAREKGKAICQNLINTGQIVAENTQDLHLTIYTPKEMEKTGVMIQFWKGFFENWGLPDSHYRFE